MQQNKQDLYTLKIELNLPRDWAIWLNNWILYNCKRIPLLEIKEHKLDKLEKEEINSTIEKSDPNKEVVNLLDPQSKYRG